jgi:hypothetical protein
MKVIFKIFAIVAFTAFMKYDVARAQCNAEALANNCISNLQDGFTFLKTFKVNGQDGTKNIVEYSYVFSKDTQYYLNVCSSGANLDGIVVTMYDSQRHVVSTNFNNGKFYPGLIYPCNATGIYYITFTFKGSKTYCGGSVLGFKR